MTKETATPARTSLSALAAPANRETPRTIAVAISAPRKAISGTVRSPRNRPVCKSAKIAPKAPPDEMPNRCGSASTLRVTACRLAPTRASPAPTIIARSARGKRISHTMASRPWLHVCSTRSGQSLLRRMLHTVLGGTATAPTDTAMESESSSTASPPAARTDRISDRAVRLAGTAASPMA